MPIIRSTKTGRKLVFKSGSPEGKKPEIDSVDPNNVNEGYLDTEIDFVGDNFRKSTTLKINDSELTDKILTDKEHISGILASGLPVGVYDVMAMNKLLSTNISRSKITGRMLFYKGNGETEGMLENGFEVVVGVKKYIDIYQKSRTTFGKQGSGWGNGIDAAWEAAKSNYLTQTWHSGWFEGTLIFNADISGISGWLESRINASKFTQMIFDLKNVSGWTLSEVKYAEFRIQVALLDVTGFKFECSEAGISEDWGGVGWNTFTGNLMDFIGEENSTFSFRNNTYDVSDAMKPTPTENRKGLISGEPFIRLYNYIP